MMMLDFLRSREIDIALIQLMTDQTVLINRDYAIHHNIGPNLRGTAVLIKHSFQASQVIRSPSGRAIAATINSLHIVNMYSPSGTAKRKEMEVFFNQELPDLLYSAGDNILIGGDINCTLSTTDTTGISTNSRTLASLVAGWKLTDTWTQDRQ
jgi:exonuclease III